MTGAVEGQTGAVVSGVSGRGGDRAGTAGEAIGDPDRRGVGPACLRASELLGRLARRPGVDEHTLRAMAQVLDALHRSLGAPAPASGAGSRSVSGAASRAVSVAVLPSVARLVDHLERREHTRGPTSGRDAGFRAGDR